MPERIVVCFRARPQNVAGQHDANRLESIRFFLQRAEPLGARVCSWGSLSFAFAFLVEELEEALEFVIGHEARPHAALLCIGISQGEIIPMLEVRGLVELDTGLPIARAMALARMAQTGEVLVDSEVEALHRGELITSGSRLIREQGLRVRGYILDLRQPWRAAAERALESLRDPALVGREQALAEMQVSAGTLGILRADPGLGGTRMLQAITQALSPGPVLSVQPAGFGAEPLGSLRKALARDVAQAGMRNLPHADTEALENLLAGRGVDIASAAYLLEEWMAPPGASAPGIVVIDDASEVDADTLDVIASALLGAARPFRCIARLDSSSPLPAQLAPLPPGPELEMGPLPDPQAELLTAAWLGGTPGAAWVRMWGRRGGGVPLAIGESLAEALSSGELAVDDQGVHARTKVSARPRARAARDWIARRLALVPSEPRALLYALATLGGDAEIELVRALLQTAADAPVELERAAELLKRRRWLLAPQDGWLSLPSRTHSQVLLESVPEARRVSWHRAASLVIEARGGALAYAEASRQASFAGDHRRSARLALEASKAAASALLENTARDLRSMARTEDPAYAAGDLSSPPSAGADDTVALSLPAPAASFAAQLTARSARHDARKSYPPIEEPVVPRGASIAAPAPAAPEPTTVKAAGPTRKAPAASSRLKPPPPPAIPKPPAVPSEAKGPETAAAKGAKLRPPPPASAPKLLLPETDPALPDMREPMASKEPSILPPARRAAPSMPFDERQLPPPRERMLSKEPSLFPPPGVAVVITSAQQAIPGLPAMLEPERAEEPPETLQGEPEPNKQPSSPPHDQQTIEQDSSPPPPRDEQPSLVELTDDDFIERDAASSTRSARVRTVDRLAESLPLLAREALTARDSSLLEHWAESEPMTSDRERLLVRLRAIVSLERGEKGGESLRVLREACHQAKACGPVEQSRSHLAYGIGLAQTGRALEALVEGLEALSRAREGSEPKAERACTSFLHKIYVGTGHTQQALVWAEILKATAPVAKTSD